MQYCSSMADVQGSASTAIVTMAGHAERPDAGLDIRGYRQTGQIVEWKSCGGGGRSKEPAVEDVTLRLRVRTGPSRQRRRIEEIRDLRGRRARGGAGIRVGQRTGVVKSAELVWRNASLLGATW